MRISAPTIRYQMLLLLLVVLTVLPAFHGAAFASDVESEYELGRLINEERRAAGLNELPLQTQLTTVAREWSAQMAKDNDLYHRPDLATRIDGDWTALGENVGVGPTISRLHSAFMNSVGHAKNVLGNWTNMGIGVVESGDRLWVTVNFSRGQIAGTSSPVPAETTQTTQTTQSVETVAAFGDVYVTGVHASSIVLIYEAGIASGYGDEFRPNASITRAQMATYVANALGLDTSGTSSHADVTSSNVHTGSIAAVTEAGIMRACATNKFCPSAEVTRGEMAQILTDAFELPTGTTWNFTDVAAGSTLSSYVSAIAEAGITSGCTAEAFCPGDPVTRGQMATFFATALGLA